MKTKRRRKKRVFVTFCYIIIITCITYTVITSHILTPLSFIEFDIQGTAGDVIEEPIIIEESNELDSTCYKGSLDDRISYREYINGILNYMCQTYGQKNVQISVAKASEEKVKKAVLAGTSGNFGIEIYYNTLDKYALDKTEVARIIYHEYIHLLMLKNLANIYTIDYKSKQLIDKTASHFRYLNPGDLYPTDYAYSSSREQIAEILSYYFIKRTTNNANKEVFVTSFEKELYTQLMYNLKKN